jgi:hypothetical protein
MPTSKPKRPKPPRPAPVCFRPPRELERRARALAAARGVNFNAFLTSVLQAATAAAEPS